MKGSENEIDISCIETMSTTQLQTASSAVAENPIYSTAPPPSPPLPPPSKSPK